MAAIPAALSAINTKLQVGDGASPEVFKTVANVSSIKGLDMSIKSEDVTSHSTANSWRQFWPTLHDAGVITTKIFYIPDSVNNSTELGHSELLALFMGVPGQTSTIHNWKIIFPDDSAAFFECQGFVEKFSSSEPVDGVVTADLSIRMTGIPIIPVAA